MKVLLVTPEFPPHSLGGGGLMVKRLSHKLGDRNNQIIVLSGLYKVNSLFDRPLCTKSKGLKVVWLPLLPTPKVGFQLNTIMPPNLYSVVELLRFFLKRDFDIVHIHGYGHFFVDLSAFLGWIVGKPYVYTIHGFPKEPLRQGGILKVLYGFYGLFIGGPLIRKAAKIIAVSHSLAKECQQYAAPDKITVIPNALDSGINPEPPAWKIPVVVGKHKLQGKKIILGIGRLSVAKGFQYVINALPLVLQNFPQAQLVIIGKDDGYGYSQELERMTLQKDVRQNVSFLGHVSDEEKTVLLWSADVVVIPSIEEVFGLVALEAMAAGRPIVASKVGGLAEVLCNDKYTTFVESENVELFALALISSLRDNKTAFEAIQNRYNRISRFDLEHVADDHLKLYMTLLRKRKSNRFSSMHSGYMRKN